MMNLSDDIKNELNMLLSSSMATYIVYKELARLENVGKKYTLEYYNLLNDLKKCRDVEDKIYDFIKSFQIDMMKLLLYITNDLSLRSALFSIDDINLVQDKIFIKRVAYRIQEDIILSQNKEISTSDSKKSYCNNGRIYNNYKFLKAIDDDLIQAFLNINEEKILLCEDIEVKQALIMIKYKIMFLNQSLEKNMIDKSFVVSQDIFFAHPFMFQTLQIDKGKTVTAYYDYCNKILEEQLQAILSYKNEKQNKEILIQLLIRSTLLTSILLFFDKNEKKQILKRVKRDYGNVMKSSFEFFDKYILSCFDEYNYQTSKKKVISL